MSVIKEKNNGFKFRRLVILSTVLTGLVACGGGGAGESSLSGQGEIIGTGFTGMAAIGAPLSNKQITIKSSSGSQLTTQSDVNGNFASAELKESSASAKRGPYLLRIDQGNGDYLYSIAYSDNAESLDSDSASIAVNIHPFTNLIVRNWFATQGLNIDTEFEKAGALSGLPPVAQINAIHSEMQALLKNVLVANGAADNLNLLSTPFTQGDGFDVFLENSTIVINNQFINVIVNDPVLNLQTTIIGNLDLGTDFTNASDNAPSVPQYPRALPAGANDAIVVWDPSTDDKGVAGYRVYRDGILIATTAYPVYKDSSLQGGIEYAYSIEAVDGRNQASARSVDAAVILGAIDTTPPPVAGSITGTASLTGISLTWTQTGIDDVASFRVLRGPAGNANTVVARITSTVYHDLNVVEGTSYCYRIVSLDAAGNASAASAEACATMAGSPPVGSSFEFAAADFSTSEVAGSAVITVNRLGDVSLPASVRYFATSGTAIAGEDFTETSGVLNWIATDSTSKTFAVQIAADGQNEGNETVVLSLSDAVNASLGNVSNAILTITDVQVSCVDLQNVMITVNTTLNLPCYNVDQSITIRDAATLTINPGVKLVFASGTELEVEGDGILRAIGTAAQPILFTGEIQAPGYWKGLKIKSIATSELAHAVVEYGGGNSINVANVEVSLGGKLRMTDSVIRYSASYGIALSGSTSTLSDFSNNTITLNESAPVLLYPEQAGMLSESSQYTGNLSAGGESRDYIEMASSSHVSKDQRWNNLGVPYRMHTGITNIDSKLTLVPGVTLVFPAAAQLSIVTGGTLQAIGTQAEPILFTGLVKEPGYWQGIQFSSNSSPNILDYVVVEYGGSPLSNVDANVGVFGNNGRLAIRNTVLQKSAGYGFNFASNVQLEMDAVMSTQNKQPGIIPFNDIGKLSKNSIYTGNTDDRLEVGLSTVTRAQTMQKLDVPYLVSLPRSSNVDAELTIEAGTEIQFASGGGLNVSHQGTLIVRGTTEAPIIFTGSEKVKGYWEGIELVNSNRLNVIDHAVIEYAGSNSGYIYALLGLFGNANAEITNTVFRGSMNHGLEISRTATGTFSGNTFEAIDGENVRDLR